MSRLRRLLSDAVFMAARLFGTSLRDARTGEPLGRALLLPWRGRILVLGLRTPVRPVFLPQSRLTYWRQDLGFTRHDPVDFPHAPRS